MKSCTAVLLLLFAALCAAGCAPSADRLYPVDDVLLAHDMRLQEYGLRVPIVPGVTEIKHIEQWLGQPHQVRTGADKDSVTYLYFYEKDKQEIVTEKALRRDSYFFYILEFDFQKRVLSDFRQIDPTGD